MTVADALARAQAAVADLDAAVAAELSTLPGEQLDSLVGEVWRLADLMEVSRTAVVGEWEGRGRFRLDGSRSASARLARDMGCSSATAAAVSRRGRFLRRFERCAEAFHEGAVTPDKVDVLARAAIPARRGLFADAEPSLVSDAKRLGCEDLKRVVKYWADAADDLLGRDPEAGQHAGRRFSCGRSLDDSFLFEGRLDPISGAIVSRELDRIAQQLFEDDWAVARKEHGAGATADQLPRTAVQRRADALRIMATRSAAMPEGSRVPRPLFVAMVDPDTARRICELADGTVVTPGALAPWIAAADVERAIFDSASRVIDLGRRDRFFRGGLRRAIEIRDRHCTFPGCTVPAEHCDVDHIVEFVDGGPTTQANGRLRCPAHNRQRPGRRNPPGPSGDGDHGDDDPGPDGGSDPAPGPGGGGGGVGPGPSPGGGGGGGGDGGGGSDLDLDPGNGPRDLPDDHGPGP